MILKTISGNGMANKTGDGVLAYGEMKVESDEAIKSDVVGLRSGIIVLIRKDHHFHFLHSYLHL